MILSMTGFGKAVAQINGKKVTAEVKSLNSKQIDLSVRVPQQFRELELELRDIASQALKRGKVEMTFTCENASCDENHFVINTPLLKSYKTQLQDLARELDINEPADWYATLLKLPDALKTDNEDDTLDEQTSAQVKALAAEALAALVEFRKQEGARLETFFEEKINAIQQLLDEVPKHEVGRVDKIKSRITEALGKIEFTAYDNNRLEQELIYYIEKLDITEEKIRLQNHLKYFLDTLHNEEQQGKKLGFISQEMGREINTLGSKANEAELQKVVVRMKDHLEQIKEQVLNVL